MAGRLDELVTPLSAYGLPLGEAFQLRDDVLGAFGDASATGKPVGDDLREGKPTPLLAIASERAEGVDAKRLEQVGDAELGSDAVADVQEVLIATGALAEVESRIDALTLEALAALADAPITSEAKEALTALAHFVAKRDR